MKKLLSGNEALARGAWEAGVRTAFAYPGTPSTEILENLVKMDGVYCEWSPNEKVALESAAGAAIAGSRTLVTMKHVGLNVAADPLMTLSYIGVNAGLVLVSADDPGQHSSQTEQDTRHYARLAKVPVLEPADSSECILFMKRAFEISEKYGCPVIIRTETCVAHSRFLAELHDREEKPVIPFEKNPQRFVPVPIWGRKLRRNIEERMVQQAEESSSDPQFNKIFGRGTELGILSSSAASLHALEYFPEASVLKLGWCWPFPDALIRKFAASVKRLLVIETGDPILEEHVRSLGIDCIGKDPVPRCGEITPSVILKIREKVLNKPASLPEPVPESKDLPGRPPILCAGCPHRGIFYALAQFDCLVTGDIGCYTLGVFPPLSRTDMLLCMGGGFSMAHGVVKAGEKRPVAGIVGDSTFFHSGITGLLNMVYNGGKATLIVADNRTTAMTGHQEHPGTGRTLMGEPAPEASIEKIAEACGIRRIRVVDPNNIRETVAVLKEELYADEPSLVISRAPCILRDRKAVKKPFRIEENQCVNCRNCLKLGCPAIAAPDKKKQPAIVPSLCAGCGMCEEVCRMKAIVR